MRISVKQSMPRSSSSTASDISMHNRIAMQIAVFAAIFLQSSGLAADQLPLSNSERSLLVQARQELRSKNPAQRQAAVEALAEFGPRMREAIPDLWEALLDRKPAVRFASAAALAKVDPEFGVDIGTFALN